MMTTLLEREEQANRSRPAAKRLLSAHTNFNGDDTADG
jgi:hypothetical protein